ncbi:Methylated-DNA--protein-cysteine methyltransferase [Gemmatirosa kalamazoonensis]|uniref:Methylated-DNA--protein-cysteine methyltransferase n=1 Tax=Gemmatirosa kalamazoonensis TaxID=861299 RepID=W0RDE2_9BACT|nr:methylated-DNA--[protein]-cysteine S-methyltransferase [Gemmatirosa kalamazoonensis]AHG88330.1 Methylated-DNA--protein-cysteine methyltransferase [Gemmatirosa kalamazoonensis]
MSDVAAPSGATRALAVDSPVGRLLLTADDAGLVGVWFEENRHGAPPSDLAAPALGHDAASRTLDAARVQLAEYFAGARTTFELPLAPRGTPFQRRVWMALRDIPYGRTISYLDLARRVGDVRATRAVGAANGRNPLPIVVPCHRVIGTDGSLTGFGGGIARKQWLLAHEGALLL